MKTRLNISVNYNSTGWMNRFMPTIDLKTSVVGIIDTGSEMLGKLLLNTSFQRSEFYDVVVKFYNEGALWRETVGSYPNGYIQEPTTPNKQGYDFKGWFESETGGTRVTFPYPTPPSDRNLYARWEIKPQNYTWQYNGRSSQPICSSVGFNPIGDSCSVEGNIMVVSGGDIGMSGDCHELICKI